MTGFCLSTLSSELRLQYLTHTLSQYHTIFSSSLTVRLRSVYSGRPMALQMRQALSRVGWFKLFAARQVFIWSHSPLQPLRLLLLHDL